MTDAAETGSTEIEASASGLRAVAGGAPVPERLSWRTLLVYSAPALGQGFMFLFLGMYLLKYATDVLGVAPAAMGTIFLVSRVWDAVSDPMAGFLSDATRTRWGRRRPWLAVGALPVCLAFFFILTPPADWVGSGLNLWMGVSVVAFYTAMTVYNMPHDALGAELSADYVERNRVFGIRRAVFGVGVLAMFGCVAWLEGSDQPRELAFGIAVVVGVISLGLMWVPAVFLRERGEFQGRGARFPLTAIADVLRNPHARPLVLVFFLQQMGTGAVSLMAAYYADYILGDGAYVAWLMGTLFLVSVVSIPVWIRLGARFEKRSMVLFSMIVVGVSLASLGVVPEGGVWQTVVIAASAGFAIACLDVVLPSIQADVVDYDELRTGERKEGVYFAVWNFSAKTAMGLAGALVGFLLQGAGFVANAEQSPETLEAIRLLMSGIPLVFYGAGTAIFWFFRLSRDQHAAILSQLEANRRASGAR